MFKIRSIFYLIVSLFVLTACSSPVEDKAPVNTNTAAGLTMPVNTKTINMVVYGGDIADEVVTGYSGLTAFAGSEPEFRFMINANLNPIKSPDKLLDYSKPINVTYLENMEPGILVNNDGKTSGSEPAPSFIQSLRTAIANGKNAVMAVKTKVDGLFAKGKELRSNWESAVNTASTIGLVKDFMANNVEFVSGVGSIITGISGAMSWVSDLVSFVGDVSAFLGPASAVVDSIFGIVDYFFGTSGPSGPSGSTAESEYILKQIQVQFDLVFTKLETLQTSVNKIDDYLKTFAYNLSNKDYMTHFNAFEGSINQLSSYLTYLNPTSSTVVNKAMDIDGDFRSRINNFVSVAMEKQAAYLAKIQDYTGTNEFFKQEKKDYFDNFVYTIENPVTLYQEKLTAPGSVYSRPTISTQSFTENITMRNPKAYLPMDQDSLDYLSQVIAYNFYIESFLANEDSTALKGLQGDLARHFLSNSGSLKALRDAINSVYVSAKADMDALMSQVDAAEINMKNKLTGLPSFVPGPGNSIGFSASGGTTTGTLYYYLPEAYSFRGLTFYRKSGNQLTHSETGMGYYGSEFMNSFKGNWTDWYPAADSTGKLGGIYPTIEVAKIKSPKGTYVLGPMTVNGTNTAFWNMVREFMKTDFKSRMNNTVLPLAAILAAQEVNLKTYIPR